MIASETASTQRGRAIRHAGGLLLVLALHVPAAWADVMAEPPGDPVAAYFFEQEQWTGDPGEVEDVTGNAHDGTAVGAADTSIQEPAIAGDPGTCRYGSFGSGESYIEVAGLSDTLNDTASLAFWIRTTQTGAADAWQSPGVAGVEEEGGTDDIFWGWLDDTGRIGISVGNDYATEQKSTQPINDGAWRHVVLTRDAGSGETRIYINGQLDQTGTTGTGAIGNAYSSIGRIEDSTDPNFVGDLDEVHVFDEVIDPDLVDDLMAQTRPCDVAPAPEGQIAEYRMDEAQWTGASGEVTDSSGNGLHGTAMTAGADGSLPGPVPGRVCNGGRFRGEGFLDDDGQWIQARHYVEVPDSDRLSPLRESTGGSGQMAIGGWFRPAALGGTHGLVHKGQGGSSQEYQVVLDGNQLRVTLWDRWGSPEAQITLGATLTPDAWYYFGLSVERTGNTIDYSAYLFDDNGLVDSDADRIGNFFRGNHDQQKSFDGALVMGAERFSAGAPVNYFDGILDELRFFDQSLGQQEFLDVASITRPCPGEEGEIAGYVISHTGTGVTCVPQPVDITAVDDEGDPVAPEDGTAIDLSTSTGRGDWARIISGGGALATGLDGTGSASYTFPGGEPSTTLSLNHTAIASDPEGVILSAVGPDASGDSGPLVISLAGFRFLADGVPDPIPPQIAGKSSAVGWDASDIALQAVRASDEDPAVCEPAFPAGETVTVEFGAECRDPAACAGTTMAVNGAAIATSDDNGDPGSAPAWSALDLVFGADAAAVIDLEYPDAGAMRLHARYEIPLDDDPGVDQGTPSGDLMRGSSNDFVWRPFGFHVDVAGADTAVGATEPVFAAAGEAFPVTLRAVVWSAADDDGSGQPADGADLADNATTPNFGHGSTTPVATISPEIVAPAGGNSGMMTGTDFDQFDGGEQERGDVTWNEAGFVDMVALLPDYQGAGAVTGAGRDVGRFIPDHFTLAGGDLVDRAELAGCGDGFTYIGERFDAEFTLTARGFAGNRTRNYSGDYARLTAAQLAMGATDDDEDLSGDLVEDASTLEWATGEGEAALELRLARAAPAGPFAGFDVGTSPVDADDVGLLAPDLALDGGAQTHALVGRTMLRFGRIVMDSALGSELAPLALPLHAAYWDGSTWRGNEMDDCTALDLAAEVRLTGDTGATVDGTQTVTLATGGQTEIVEDSPVTLEEGRAALTFSAPGTTGWVDAVLQLEDRYSFLRDDLADDGVFDDDPSARASFGLFGGNTGQIYRDEILR